MPERLSRIRFAGFEFDVTTANAVIAELAAREPQAPFAYATTPNVDHAVRFDALAGDEAAEIGSSYRGARWCLCDSRILGRLAALKGVDLPVVPGSDLTARLFAEVIVPGDHVAIVGGDADTLPALRERYSGIHFEQHMPPMGLRHNRPAQAEAAAFIARRRARFTFIIVGSPQQELVALATAQRGDAVGTGLCVGASIEFLIGKVSRAPRWMQHAGLEWSHRLLSDPRRLWRRYLVDGPRIFLIAFRKKG